MNKVNTARPLLRILTAVRQKLTSKLSPFPQLSFLQGAGSFINALPAITLKIEIGTRIKSLLHKLSQGKEEQLKLQIF